MVFDECLITPPQLAVSCPTLRGDRPLNAGCLHELIELTSLVVDCHRYFPITVAVLVPCISTWSCAADGFRPQPKAYAILVEHARTILMERRGCQYYGNRTGRLLPKPDSLDEY